MVQFLVILTCLLSLLCCASADTYYVTTSANDPCPPGSFCRTLEEYADEPPDDPSNVTLLFMEGEHALARDFSLQDLDNLAFETDSPGINVTIFCFIEGRLIFDNISIISIDSISMVGCYGNYMAYVDHLAVVNSSIQGLPTISSQTVFNVLEIQKFEVFDCTFTSNKVSVIGTIGCSVFSVNGSNMKLLDTLFDRNRADNSSVLSSNLCLYGSNVSIVNSRFTNNSALTGGVLHAKESSVLIYGSKFLSNRALLGGALHIIEDSLAVINRCTFELNRADSRGGAILVRTNSNIRLSDSTFFRNVAVEKGGVLFSQFSKIFASGRLNIEQNRGGNGAIYMTNSFAEFTGNLIFTNNRQSFFAYSSEISFVGESFFEGGASDVEDEGGALTAFRSTLKTAGNFSVLNNRGHKGGGILLTESFLFLHGECTFLNNSVNDSGGAVSAQKSNIQFSGHTVIQGNEARIGGGVFLGRSSIEYRSNFLSFINNTAHSKGGGVYFDQTSTLHIVKEKMECENDMWYCVTNPDEWLLLTFDGNSAKQGGALYVNDNYADTCYSGGTHECSECFIQTVAAYVRCSDWNSTEPNFANINFVNNTATDNGSLLYGGLLDRCRVDAYAELKPKFGDNPFGYFEGMCRTAISGTEVSSDPVRICFCDDNYIADCRKEAPNYPNIQRGVMFTVAAVIVDQMDKPVNGSVVTSLSSESSRLLSKEQSKQTLWGHCTDLEFTIFSADESEILNLYADGLYTEGPCTDRGISLAKVGVSFTPDCPVGFTLSESSLECGCDHILKDFADCIIENQTILRRGNVWISAWNANASDWSVTNNQSDGINDTNSRVFVHQYCPYDYCYPPTQEGVLIDLNYENGSDGQCTFHRSGLLCGCCDTENGYSLTLGSSRCEICTNDLVRLYIIILFGLAGIVLVILMMFCNLTLASGTLNGLLFYANIVIANRSIFFPFQSFLTVFVSWLGLNLGIATCFFNGMNSIWKVWLQILFEVYLMILMFIIVQMGRSVKVSTFFHKYNLHPVNTLATLVMLSYEKLCRNIFSFVATIELVYPDNSTNTVWLYDPCLKYELKHHLPLAIIAACIVITGVIFNLVLLFNKVIIARCRSVYFNSFMVAFYAPFKPKHQYWVGLLLLIRNISYLISEVLNAGKNPSTNLHFIFSLVVGLLLIKFFYVSMPNFKHISLACMKGIFHQRNESTAPSDLTERDGEGVKLDKAAVKIKHVKERGIVYKNPYLDILETSFLVNLLVLTYFTLYLMEGNQVGQGIVFNISSAIVLITFVGILIYHTCTYTHVSKLIRKHRQRLADETVPLHRSGESYGSTITTTHSEI